MRTTLRHYVSVAIVKNTRRVPNADTSGLKMEDVPPYKS